MTYTFDNRNSSPPIPSGAPQGRTNVDLGDDTAALIAAVPAMLGFRPENSMVFLGLSRPADDRATPSGIRPTSSEVGPVVRADLVEGAVTGAAKALIRANSHRTDRSVIILVVGGDAGPLVDTAVRLFRSAGHLPAAAFLATDLCAGASWWEIPLDGSGQGAGNRDWPIGALPDPASSPAAGHTAGREPGEIPDQAAFDRLLDKEPVPQHLRGLLPGCWTGRDHGVAGDYGVAGEDGDVGETSQDIVALCGFIDHLATVDDQDATLRTLLGDEDAARFITRVCCREPLARVLVVLSTGPFGKTVQNLLAGTARIARGPLRYRALVLLSMAAWCGSGGVLAHRAAHRVLVESDRPGSPGVPAGQVTGGTLKLARELVATAEQGRPAGVIARMIDGGVRDIDDTLVRAGDEGVGELLGRVVDRDSVSVVRNELGRRARR